MDSVISGTSNIDLSETPQFTTPYGSDQDDDDTDSDMLLDNDGNRPMMGFTENNSLTYLATGNPCLDLFFHVVPDTPAHDLIRRLELAWRFDLLTTVKLVCNLRGVRGTGKSDKEGCYTSALWLHRNHLQTLTYGTNLGEQNGKDFMNSLPAFSALKLLDEMFERGFGNAKHESIIVLAKALKLFEEMPELYFDRLVLSFEAFLGVSIKAKQFDKMEYLSFCWVLYLSMCWESKDTENTSIQSFWCMVRVWIRIMDDKSVTSEFLLSAQECCGRVDNIESEEVQGCCEKVEATGFDVSGIGSDFDVYVQDLIPCMEMYKKLDKHHGCVNTISFSPRGDILLFGFECGSDYGIIRMGIQILGNVAFSGEEHHRCAAVLSVVGFASQLAYLLKVVSQIWNVGGLQVSKDDKWVTVQPLSDAIVVILANQTEILTMGRIKLEAVLIEARRKPADANKILKLTDMSHSTHNTTGGAASVKAGDGAWLSSAWPGRKGTEFTKIGSSLPKAEFDHSGIKHVAAGPLTIVSVVNMPLRGASVEMHHEQPAAAKPLEDKMSKAEGRAHGELRLTQGEYRIWQTF